MSASKAQEALKDCLVTLKQTTIEAIRPQWIPILLINSIATSMFDKIHLIFNFKSKLSRDVFKKKKERMSTYVISISNVSIET